MEHFCDSTIFLLEHIEVRGKNNIEYLLTAIKNLEVLKEAFKSSNVNKENDDEHVSDDSTDIEE